MTSIINRRRILVTGAAGVIGKRLSEYLCEMGYEVIPVDIVPCKEGISVDLRDEVAVFRIFEKCDPSIVLHIAAIKNLNFCEESKGAERSANYGITEILTRACAEFETRMIFFSSDYVFGKYDHFWKEEDPPCPTTQYGIDKAASEQLIRERLSNYAIVRTAQLYGFSGDFVSLVCEALIAHEEFIAFSNLVNCPTWIRDLFPMINKIIDQDRCGIFHCVGPEAMSRYEYACEIAKAFSLDTTYIKAVELDYSMDIRPPVVRLNGASTYEALQLYPGRLKDNLPSCGSSPMDGCPP